jgi:sec-independent protein translocase protein TatA
MRDEDKPNAQLSDSSRPQDSTTTSQTEHDRDPR